MTAQISMRYGVRFALLSLIALLVSLASGAGSAWAADGAVTAGSAQLSIAVEDDGDSETGVVEAGEWRLNYTVGEDGATITGVETAPSEHSDLEIPAQAGGADVTAIAEDAFAQSDKLGAVTLPESLRFIGQKAFSSSSITSIAFPAALEYIPYQCFWSCASLKTVTFAEGCTPEFIATRAFMKCSSLEEIVIPPLMGKDYDWICEDPTATFSGKGSWRIGMQCFTFCSSLKTIVFKAGNPNGISEYLKSGGQQFGYNASGMKVINYCKGTTSRYASTAKWYFAVNFYQSKADADADPARVNPWKQLVYPAETNLLAILNGATEVQAYAGSDELPEMPKSDSAGIVWGVSDSAMSSARSTLQSSIEVYPVDRHDLDYGWVSSPEIEKAAGTNSMVASTDNASFVRLPVSGPADVSGMAVYAADGSKLDPSDYVLKYEVGKRVPRPNSSSFDTEYSELESADAITEEGNYRVHAVGVGAFSDTKTKTASFSVRHYRASVSGFSGQLANDGAGLAVEQAVKSLAEKPIFMVVASAKSWQESLIAAALAGVGEGVAALADGDDTSAAAYRAVQTSDSNNIIFLGSSSVTSSVISKVKSNVGSGGRFDTIEGSTPEQMSLNVYNTVKKYGPSQSKPYNWGETAIIVSQSAPFNVALIAQYAYQAKAPVFFADEAGSLSKDVLAALGDGGFSTVALAGDFGSAYDTLASAIQSTSGVNPVHLLSDVSNGYQASKEFSDSLRETFVDQDGNPVNRVDGAVLADSRNVANVIAAAQLAAITNSTVYNVASTADLKLVERLLAQGSADTTTAVYLVGDFSWADSDVTARMQSVWSTPASFAIGQGDTAESSGLIYKLGAGSNAALVGLLDSSIRDVKTAVFDVDGKRYTPSAIGAGALKGNTSVISVTSSATSIGDKAFNGCTSLARIDLVLAAEIGSSSFEGCSALAAANLPATNTIGFRAFYGCGNLASVAIPAAKSINASAFEKCSKLDSIDTKATSIGASAFAGCTSLKKATLSAAALAQLPDSLFAGCASLASATVLSTSLKSVGQSAFAQCPKLSTITLKSKKIASIGASAFSGCAGLKTASFQSSVLKSIGSQAFSGCKKLSTLTFKSSKITKVGSKAFRGVKSKIKVKVPKAKIKKYKKMFRKAGLSKKAKVSKA